MQPKRVGEVAFTQSDINCLTSTLLHMTAVNTNWAAVQKDTGVSSASNAARDFRRVLKKLGLKLSNGAIVEDGDTTSTTAPATPMEGPKATKKRGAVLDSSTSSKKRKQNGEIDGSAEGEARKTFENSKELETPVKAKGILKEDSKDLHE